MRTRSLALLLTLALGACGAPPPGEPPIASGTSDPVPVEAELPPIPFCRDQMTAYVELVRLARSQGENWVVFAPALDALRQQIVDCVSDGAEHFHELKLSPAPPPLLPDPPPAPACAVDCASARSAALLQG